MNKAIKLIRGDSRDIIVHFKDADGDDLDLAGGTVFFTVNASENPSSDSGAVISKNVTDHTDEAGGISTISLSAADTTVTPGDYYYDVQLKDSSGGVMSSSVGMLTVAPDITRRTS